jgi:hypothetical protein
MIDPVWTGAIFDCIGAWGIADVDWRGNPAPTCTLGIVDGFAYIYIK